MVFRNLSMDVLRSFVVGTDLGSFSKAGERLGRSASAVSLQLKTLEDQVGRPLFQKNGRKLGLTDAGETLLGYARRLLDLNDEALLAVTAFTDTGWVRLGLPPDMAETWLPAILNEFVLQRPDVRTEAHADIGPALIDGLARGDLDLALIWNGIGKVPHGVLVAEVPMVWVGQRSGFRRAQDRPVPLVALAPPCMFRDAAVAALDAADIPWRLAHTSSGRSGVSAGVAAGLGITIRTAHGMPAALKALDPQESNLPPLPRLSLSLHTAAAPRSPAVDALAALLKARLQPRPMFKVA